MSIELLIPPVIGGIIGYFTNYVAIKMLFRPKKAVYLGKWKLPFTPGLIPSKREKLAISIARVVKENLLTEETLRKRLNEQKVLDSIKNFVNKGLDGLIESMPDYLKQLADSASNKKLFDVINISEVEKIVQDMLLNAQKNRTTINDILPDAILSKKEKIINAMTEKILEIAKQKANSEEFTAFLADRIQNILEESGKIPDIAILKKPIKTISITLASRTAKAINETLEKEAFKQTVKVYISQILDEFTKQPVIKLIDKGEDINTLSKKISNLIHESFNIPVNELPFMKKQFINLLTSWIKSSMEKNRESIVNITSSKLLEIIEKELPVIMESLDLENMVAEKVNSLPIDEVEGIILKLIDEELKYITLLGGLLGFIIGAFQDILFFVK
ncbi:DUF445 family protein [Desulfurobacterium sp.]